MFRNCSENAVGVSSVANTAVLLDSTIVTNQKIALDVAVLVLNRG